MYSTFLACLRRVLSFECDEVLPTLSVNTTPHYRFLIEKSNEAASHPRRVDRAYRRHKQCNGVFSMDYFLVDHRICLRNVSRLINQEINCEYHPI